VIKAAEALGGLCTVPPTPRHAQKIPGEQDQEQGNEKQLVNEKDDPVHDALFSASLRGIGKDENARFAVVAVRSDFPAC